MELSSLTLWKGFASRLHGDSSPRRGDSFLAILPDTLLSRNFVELCNILVPQDQLFFPLSAALDSSRRAGRTSRSISLTSALVLGLQELARTRFSRMGVGTHNQSTSGELVHLFRE